MNKRPLLLCSAAYLTGILFFLWKQPFLLLILPFLLILYGHRRHTAEVITGGVFVILFFILGNVFYGQLDTAYEMEHTFFLEDGAQVYLQGQISGKQWKGDNLYITLDHVYLKKKKEISLHTKVLLLCGEDTYPYGDVLLVKGKVSSFSLPGNLGEFDEAFYYRSKEICGRVVEGDCERVAGATGIAGGWAFLQENLWVLRRQLVAAYLRLMPGEEGGIMASVCLGDRSALDFDVKSLFSDSGIAHILAISGLHISLVGGFVYRRLKRRGLSFGRAALISSLVVVVYALLSGGGVSVKRSVFMYLVLMGAKISGEAYDLISAAALSALILLVLSPLSLHDSGLLLSFAAVFGVGGFVLPMSESYLQVQKMRYEANHKMIKGEHFQATALQSLFGSLLSAMGIQIFMLPVTAGLFHQVCPYTVFLNVMVIPLLSLVLSWGLMGGVFGLGSAVMGGILLWPCHKILYLYEMLSDRTLSLPFATVSVRTPSLIVVIIYYATLLILPKVTWQVVSSLRKQQDKKLPWKKKRYFGVFGNKKLELSFCLLMTFLVLLLFYRPADTGFVMLDVGQGDGLVVTSAGGSVDLIDGGSSQKSRVGEYTILPYLRSQGISRVDHWFLTHMDTDHVSGCLELLQRNFPIGEVLMPQAVDRSHENYKRIKDLCNEKKIPIYYLLSGDVLGEKDVTYGVIYPDEKGSCEEDGNNENSLVMLLSMKAKGGRTCRIMLTGDLGSRQEEKILQNTAYRRQLTEDLEGGKVDVLKGGHHGSNGSNSLPWLKALDPDLCLISAGKKNRYGHPARETMERLKEEKIKALVTKDRGGIFLTYDRKGGLWQVRTFR